MEPCVDDTASACLLRRAGKVIETYLDELLGNGRVAVPCQAVVELLDQRLQRQVAIGETGKIVVVGGFDAD